MTAKEYLERIGKLERKISAMKMRSAEYDRLSLSIPGPSYGERIGSNPNRNTEAPFLKWIIKKHDLDLEIEKLEKKLKDMQAEALLKIEELENEDFTEILNFINTNIMPSINDKSILGQDLLNLFFTIPINFILNKFWVYRR